MDYWISGPMALGHCMLRTMPGSGLAKQPMFDSRHGLAAVMAGRLDNRKELFDRLEPDFEWQNASEIDFLLAAYRRWGKDSPRYLLGDFAFAIWDSRRHELFCARDQMGCGQFLFRTQRPLFLPSPARRKR